MRIPFLTLLLLLACDPITYQPPPITTTTIQPIETRPPRVDEVLTDLYNVTGCTAFGAALLNEGELTSLIYHGMARGCDVYRVGAQTDGWCGTGVDYLEDACGPPVGTREWRENLERLLDVSARIPGVYIQLIPTFTHKQDPGGLDRAMRIIEQVIAIVKAGGFKHIVWEAVNEYVHPISRYSTRDVAAMLVRLRKTGLPVGADEPGSRRSRIWEAEYSPELLLLVDYIALHPPRNEIRDGECTSIRPSFNQLRDVVMAYNLPVWIDEPTCALSDAMKSRYGIGDLRGHYALCGGGSEQDRRAYIRAYADDVRNAGAVWFTHTLWGFECRYLDWLPNY